MKLKYYLRGAGIGVIVSTIILTVAFAFSKGTVSDEEIIRRAEAMGYVKQEDAIAKAEKTEESNSDAEVKEQQKTIDAEVGDKADDNVLNEDPKVEEPAEEDTKKNEDEVVTYVPFTVSPGQTSNAVADNMKKAGLIEDATDFNLYMNAVGVDSLIQSGTFYVKKGSSYDDLCAILVTKQDNRENVTPPANAQIVE